MELWKINKCLASKRRSLTTQSNTVKIQPSYMNLNTEAIGIFLLSVSVVKFALFHDCIYKYSDSKSYLKKRMFDGLDAKTT